MITLPGLPVVVQQGDVEVTYIHGEVSDRHFLLYVGTSDRYPRLSVYCTGCVTMVEVQPGDYDEEGNWHPSGGVPAFINLPPNWEVGVRGVTKNCGQIIGVRPMDITSDVPFAVDTSPPGKEWYPEIGTKVGDGVIVNINGDAAVRFADGTVLEMDLHALRAYILGGAGSGPPTA